MEKGGEQSDEDNPFSFKTFLKRGTEDPAEKKRGKKPGTRKKKTQPPASSTSANTTTQGIYDGFPIIHSWICIDHCVIH